MHRLIGETREAQETWEVPAWSGVPITVGNLMVVALHASDMRHLTLPPDWQHTGFWVSEDGEVEYHVYRERI